jgi:hypothetical protein
VLIEHYVPVMRIVVNICGRRTLNQAGIIGSLNLPINLGVIFFLLSSEQRSMFEIKLQFHQCNCILYGTNISKPSLFQHLFDHIVYMSTFLTNPEMFWTNVRW